VGDRRLDRHEARWAVAGLFGAGRDVEIVSTYHDLVRGPLRPMDGDYVQRMREALLDAAERGQILVFEARIVGSSTRREVEEADTPAPTFTKEKAYELAFKVTCEATGKPLPVVPYEVRDAEGDLVASGRTSRSGEVLCGVSAPGKYKVLAFPNDRVRLELELMDDNFDLLADTDVTFRDAEGNEQDLHTNRDGLTSCGDVQCGLATVTVGDKSAKLYVDSAHPGVRRVRVPGYFLPPPAWSERDDHEVLPTFPDEA
jgi:hypothetical protein